MSRRENLIRAVRPSVAPGPRPRPALTCAPEGADIIRQIESVQYRRAQQSDFDETVRQVEALDRRIVAVEADVRF